MVGPLFKFYLDLIWIKSGYDWDKIWIKRHERTFRVLLLTKKVGVTYVLQGKDPIIIDVEYIPNITKDTEVSFELSHILAIALLK